mgnify:CR=1 FL=1
MGGAVSSEPLLSVIGIHRCSIIFDEERFLDKVLRTIAHRNFTNGAGVWRHDNSLEPTAGELADLFANFSSNGQARGGAFNWWVRLRRRHARARPTSSSSCAP